MRKARSPQDDASAALQADELLDSSRAGAATIRGSAVRTAGYGVSVLLSLIAAPLLVRHLGIVEFGRYMTVVSLVALAGGVTDAGLTSVAVREWTTRGPHERNQLMRDLLGLRVALTCLGLGVALCFGLAAGYRSDLIAGIGLAGLGLVFQVVQNAYSVPLQSDLSLGWVTLADFLRHLVSVGLIVALVVFSAKVIAFLAVPIPASLGALVLTAALVWRRLPLRPGFNLRRWRTLAREALPVAAAVALHHLYLRIVIVLMSLIAAGLETGYFATSFRVSEVLIQVPFLIAQSTLPVLARAAHTDPDRLAYAVRRLFEASTIVGVAVMLAVIAGAPLVVQVLTGSGGGAIVAVLRLQSLAVLLVFLTVTWQNALFALRRQASLVASNAIGVAATAAATLVLVPLLQARGAALAAALGELALTLSSAVFLLRASPRLTLSLRFLPRVLAAGGFGGAVFLIPGLPTVARAALVTAVYGVALVALGGVPAELRQAVIPGRFASLRGR